MIDGGVGIQHERKQAEQKPKPRNIHAMMSKRKVVSI